MKTSNADLCIYLAECLRDVDGISINWRALLRYLEGFEEEKKVKVKVNDAKEFWNDYQKRKKKYEKYMEKERQQTKKEELSAW